MSTNYLILAEFILIVGGVGLFYWWDRKELRKYKTGEKTDRKKQMKN